MKRQILSLAGIALLGFSSSALRWWSYEGQNSSDAPKDIPAYHDDAEEQLPATLPSTQFSGDSARAYEEAGKIKKVLYQQPCYCYCDRDKTKKHTSLLDCFRTEHASQCSICKKEAIYAYEQTQAGKLPAQIRREIIDGKWQQVKLSSDGK